MRRRARAWAKWTVAALAGLELAWLLVVNGILAVHLIPRQIRSHTASVDMDYRLAWSLYPGDLQVRGYWIQGRDAQHLAFRFEVDRARASVDLRALLHKTFRATRVRTEGVTARFRMLAKPGAPEDPFQPPLAPMAVPLAASIGPPDPEVAKQAWRADLEDVAIADLREVWVGPLRARLDADVTGRFKIHPGRRIELGPAALDVRRGVIQVAGREVLSGIEGRVAATLEPTEVEAISGSELLRKISGEIAVHAEVTELAALEELTGLKVQGAGSLVVRGRVERGLLLDGSGANLDLSRAEARISSVRVKGSVRGTLRVHGGVDTVAEVSSPSVELAGTAGPLLSGGEVRVAARTPRADLVSPTADAEVSADLHGLHAGDLGAWLAHGALPVTIKTGALGLDGHLDLDTSNRSAHGELQLATRDLDGDIEGEPVRADVHARVPVRLQLGDVVRVDASGTTVRVDVHRAARVGKSAEGWWLDAHVTEAHLALEERPRGLVKVEAHAPNGKPLIELLSRRGPLPGVIASAFQLPDLAIEGEARFGDGVLTLLPLHVHGGRAELSAAVRLEDRAEGALLVQTPATTVALELGPDRLKLHGLDPTAWFGEREAALRSRAAPIHARR